ncbi:MAG TPA: 2,4-dichlorophenoxyacetate dioxygenase [Rhodospirillaceae bacterium]|jgi:alpha-ketoglutarate-dependent 2,4-dichlorophenoxyacetate dioxygenase|nr:2,4-dichlorophenoxyacetate dioxygenase [Magnetovibrio sp.]HCS71846.1 2,4-dichlorophenoxyacetate dioxygenase [Rhodospirillaceae bacterium]|tara:strand:- start:921 stop:1811 length:891 start_codon:yes stop_codon:yes gene_type:complete
MAVTVKQLNPSFVGEVQDIDLSQPISDDTFAEIQAAIDANAVLIFHGPTLDEDAQAAFAERFGPLYADNRLLKTGLKDRIGPKLVDISNLNENNEKMDRGDRRRMFGLANQLWHTDASFKKVTAKYSLLHAHTVVPEGGETQFADMRAAYDALPQKMKDRIEGMVAEHCIATSRAQLGFTEFSDAERAALPPVQHDLVRVHPATGRKALYLASHASHIVGMPLPEGRMLIRDLMEHATQPQFVHTFTWQVGDLVIWDNRCTMHRARPYDLDAYRRDMRRATVMDPDYMENAAQKTA